MPSRIKRCFNAPKRSYFIFGPRGTGKSTLLEKRYPDALLIDLLDAKNERLYGAKPERLNDIISANADMNTIILDEVQRVPSLLPIVHQQIYSDNEKQFILTGSSARKLKRDGSDLLGGRASERHMHPFIASELGELFSLDSALQFGLLPLIHTEEEKQDALDAYLSLYLKEEIKAEGLVRNLESFTRFLEAISLSHASQLNVSNVSRECSVKRKTVENYIEILEDLLLAYRVPIFQKQAKRSLVTHPKFYIFDAGVFQTIRPRGPLDEPVRINGAVLEGLVAQHLRAWCDYTDEKYNLFYWRTSAGSEVDFVVYGPKGLWAMEVKHAARVDNQDVRALKTFLDDYPASKALFLYRGKEKIHVNGILCMPIEEFLLNIKPNEILF